MMLSYEAVILLAGFAAAAAVAAAAVADGAAAAADAARSLADARSAQVSAGRIVAVDVQHDRGAGRAYATVAAAPGGGAPAVLSGAWDAAGSPARCEAAGAGATAGAGIAGLAVSEPRTLVCDMPPDGGIAIAARGGSALRIAAPPPVPGQ